MEKVKKIEIPFGDKATLKSVVDAAVKMYLYHKVHTGRSVVEVHYRNPIELYFLGANVVAEGMELFKSGLTR